MSFLQKITPINLLEEKEKFLADNSYNPQFIYAEEIPEENLYKYGKPKKKYLKLAQEILDKAYFARNEQDLLMLEGPLLNQSQVNEKIQSFLEMHDLDNRYEITWSKSFVARTSITADKIKLRLPVSFRKNDLLGMLYHEIGTHAIRRVNYEQQPWYKKKKKYGFSSYLKTEEGLASLHSLLPKNYKSAFKPAIRYLAVNLAQHNSFSRTWIFLDKYIQDAETRWMVTLRQKRGISDTSKPGGYSKDLVYFEGLVDIYKYLEKNNFDISKLYFGKMALEDVGKAIKLNPDFQPVLPSFFTLNKAEYAKEIRKIGEENFL